MGDVGDVCGNVVDGESDWSGSCEVRDCHGLQG